MAEGAGCVRHFYCGGHLVDLKANTTLRLAHDARPLGGLTAVGVGINLILLQLLPNHAPHGHGVVGAIQINKLFRDGAFTPATI